MRPQSTLMSAHAAEPAQKHRSYKDVRLSYGSWVSHSSHADFTGTISPIPQILQRHFLVNAASGIGDSPSDVNISQLQGSSDTSAQAGNT